MPNHHALRATALSDSNTNRQIKKCSVLIENDYNIGDFICLNWKNNLLPRIARICHKVDQNAKVLFFFRIEELPVPLKDIEGSENIKMSNVDVIEDSCFGIKEVPLKSIISKCSVISPRQGELDPATLRKHKETRENHDVYICRYRLIKNVSYVLMPVEWMPTSVIEKRAADLRNGRKNRGKYADEQVDYHPDDPLADHHYEDEAAAKMAAIELVSPIKIKNKCSVQKLKRPAAPDSVTRESSAPIDVESDESPSKRSKNYENLHDSPCTGNKTHRKRHSSVRKNLNHSFRADDSADEPDKYEVTMSSSLKMKISSIKKTDEPVPDTPSKRNAGRKQTQVEKLISEEAHKTPQSRRSILKTPNSKNLNTPKKNVKIDENTDADINMATPSRPKRAAAAQAAAQIVVTYQLTPEEVKTPRRGRTSKAKEDPEYSTPIKVTKDRAPATPKSSKRREILYTTPSKAVKLTPQMSRKLLRSGGLTPSLQSRTSAVHENLTDLQAIRERLHVSAVPQSLPCRETEYKSIHTFVRDKIVDGCGGCIYIAGVPGTGKTATVTQVVKSLQLESSKRLLPKFDYVDINGMRLTEPHQAYVQMHRQLTGITVPWAQARDLLEKRFTKTKAGKAGKDITTILLIDELDILCNRKQDVVYNLFDWTSRKGSKLVAITIANTMDLPERVLKLKVSSRLGLTRITFQPYSFKQLQEVVMTRLAGSKSFIGDAVQLVARKVASVSGDCRRALDICRRATEIAEETTGDTNATVQFAHVTQALDEMFASPKVRAIRNCSKMEKLFLRAVATEINRTGIEEVDFISVYTQLESLAAFMGISRPPIISQAQRICLNLGASRILIVEDSTADLFQKIILNMSVDDLHFALNEAK